MDYKDYYAILGVAHNADQGAIKRSFRALARQLHPDVNPGNGEAERRFKEVNEAYAVLGDEENRRMYDRLGAQWRSAPRTAGFDWSTYFNERVRDDDHRGNRRQRTSHREEPPLDRPGEESAFSDFFQQIFNTGQRRPKRPRGKVYKNASGHWGEERTVPVEISLEEAFWGAFRTVQQGGARFEVSIPKGVKNGSKVRVSTPSGDLILVVSIKAHPTLRIDESNLRTTLNVDLYTALLGGEVQVPTLEGLLVLAIPPNTQNGRTFRLKGQGMHTAHNPNQRGDLLVDIVVTLPVPLSEEERRRFAELRRMRPPTNGSP